MTPYLLVSGDFVKTGGMDRANHALAMYLAQQGRRVHLVTHRADEDLLAMKNVTVHIAKKPMDSYYLGRTQIDRLGKKVGLEIQAQGGRVIVNGGNCAFGDVNWVHYVHAAYEPAIHGNLLKRIVARHKRKAFWKEEKVALNMAKLIITNSHRTSSDVGRLFGIDSRRINTIYLGADVRAFKPADADEKMALRQKLNWNLSDTIAVFIGALSDRRKNLDTTLSAWVKLARQPGWNVKLVVVGHGGELASWQSRLADLGLQDSVQFMGFRRDVHDIIRASDVMVAPARYEPYGLSVHEALCCAVPAIVSAKSGVSERLGANLGELIVQNENDPEQLAVALKRWFNGRLQYQTLVGSVSESLRRRDWEEMSGEMVRLIDSTGIVRAKTVLT